MADDLPRRDRRSIAAMLVTCRRGCRLNGLTALPDVVRFHGGWAFFMFVTGADDERD